MATARAGGVWICAGSQLLKCDDDGRLESRDAGALRDLVDLAFIARRQRALKRRGEARLRGFGRGCGVLGLFRGRATCASGKLLLAQPYTKVTWADGIGPNGRPILIPGQDPTEEGTKSCPGMGGGHNWQPTAYSPRTGLYYFHSTDGCQLYYKTKPEFLEGQWYQAITVDSIRSEHSSG